MTQRIAIEGEMEMMMEAVEVAVAALVVEMVVVKAVPVAAVAVVEMVVAKAVAVVEMVVVETVERDVVGTKKIRRKQWEEKVNDLNAITQQSVEKIILKKKNRFDLFALFCENSLCCR
jgi:hypothetical protein